MLRAAVALLVLANLVFFAWARGWLGPGPHHGEREPQRLAAQFRPEVLTVLPAPAASAAVRAARAAALVCLEAGPLNDADLVAAEAALQPLQLPEGSWLKEPAAPPPPWLVFAGRWPDAAARGARIEELRKLKLEVEPIDAPPDLAPGLVLSRHADKPAADAALAAAVATATAAQGRAGAASLRGVRVLSLPAAPPQTWLRLPRASPELLGKLQTLPSATFGGGFKPCAKKP